MSRTIQRKVQNFAIARAYADEPIKVVARTHLGSAVELGFESRDGLVYFPAQDVFKFDKELFVNLTAAYDESDKEKLLKLWNEASRLNEGDLV